MKTKLDHIYGNVGGDTTQLQTQVDALETKVTNLSNITAKTNLNNTFTAKQNFNNGFAVGNTQIATFSTKIEMGLGGAIANITPEDNTNKKIQFSGVSGRGRFDLEMNNVSKILNLPTPTTNKEPATKEYVDAVKGPWVQLITWTGNFKTTSLEWTKTLTTGNMHFLIKITYNGVTYCGDFVVSVAAASDKWTSPVMWFAYGTTQNAGQVIQTVPNGFFVHFDGTKIKIVKVGDNQPETSTSLLLGYWKVK